MRFEPVRMRAGLAGVGAASALLLALPGAAFAAPAPAPVDVTARAETEHPLIYPGGTVQVRAIADVASGEVAKLGVTLALPAGVTYVRAGGDGDAANATCTPSADGRSVACVPRDGQKKLVSASVYVKVGADTALGTDLPFTVTADIGDAVDTKPEDNTATAKVGVRAPADLGVEWKIPPGPVHPGKKVATQVVVTNHGPGPVRLDALGLDIPGDHWPGGYDSRCWADPGTIICDYFAELAPGATATFPFTWTFPAKAAGTTYKVPAGYMFANPLDPNSANNRATATFTITKAPGPKPTPTPKPTATVTPTATPSTPAPTPSASSTATTPPPAGGGGALADTGSGPLTALAGTAAALAGAGVLLVRARRAVARHRG